MPLAKQSHVIDSEEYPWSRRFAAGVPVIRGL
jgi:hypothetical protein